MDYKPVLFTVVAIMLGMWAYGKFVEGRID